VNLLFENVCMLVCEPGFKSHLPSPSVRVMALPSPWDYCKCLAQCLARTHSAAEVISVISV
jgi:hypothetical protein